MLHKPEEPLDADTETAIEDVLETVAEIGAQAALALCAEEGSKARHHHAATVKRLYGLVASRARSALIDPAELLNHAAARVAGNAGRSRYDVQHLRITTLIETQVAA